MLDAEEAEDVWRVWNLVGLSPRWCVAAQRAGDVI
jgi:hypothetical protein